MADLISDTHAIVWHLTDPSRLGRGAMRAFAAADSGRARCHVPAVCLVEIGLLHERGRLRVGVPQVLETLATHPGYAVLPLDVEQCLEFAALVGLRDPMDRLVAAAVRASGARLVSADAGFDRVLDGRVWD
jgi:PIN domain nuclease of toxin-antitoxin system